MTAEVKVMEIKNSSKSSDPAYAMTLDKARNYVEDLKSEVRHITWTSRDELILYTQLVVATTFLFGMALFFMDVTIHSVLNALSLILRFIGG